MLKIGLTGGIAAGKSTVSQQFARLNIPVIDTDVIAREIVQPNSDILQKIADQFGSSILLSDGSLNRAELRQRIFQDANKRRILEELMHPAIRREVINKTQALHSSVPYCILVIPLLVEKDWNDLVDRILFVDSTKSLRIKRTMQRDKLSQTEIERIMAAQANRYQHETRADDVITNNQDILHIENEVKRLHHFYLQLAESQ